MRTVLGSTNFHMPRVGVGTCVGTHTVARRFVSSFLNCFVSPAGGRVSSLLLGYNLPKKVVKSVVTSLGNIRTNVGVVLGDGGRPRLDVSSLLIVLFSRIRCM